MERRRYPVLLLVLAAAVLAWWWWPRDSGRRDRAGAPGEGSQASATAPPVRTGPPPVVDPDGNAVPAALAGPAPAAPIIDEVVVEKPVVCEGEENLVTVRAHTPDHADDAYLHATVAGDTGMSVVVYGRRVDDSEGEAPPRMVNVFGRNNAVTRVEVPHFEVEPCVPPRQLFIDYRLLPNTEDEFELRARIVELEAGPLEDVVYRWSFGDGATLETDSPVVVHSYADRPQTTHYAQLLIAVEAVGVDGDRVLGRRSLQLVNSSFEHMAYRGVVLLRKSLEPRFPVLGDDGFVEQEIRLWHDYDQPVRVTRLLRRYHPVGGATPAPPEQTSATNVLGTDRIPPSGIAATVRFNAARRTDVFSIEYVVEGVTADGIPAFGAFSVMRPPPVPTADNSTPVTDPMLKAKIVRAREVLGTDVVSQEDLWALEQSGAFDGLDPANVDRERASASAIPAR